MIINKLKLWLFACIFLAWFRVPWAPQFPRVLWRKILDNVEVAHVWMHRLVPSIGGDWRGQEGIPRSFPPYHWIWQQASSPVHQFRRPQAPRQLNFWLLIKSVHFVYYYYNCFKQCVFCFSYFCFWFVFNLQLADWNGKWRRLMVLLVNTKCFIFLIYLSI